MAFKLKSGNKTSFKGMGSSPYKSAFKATPEEMRAAGVSEGTIAGGEKSYNADNSDVYGKPTKGENDANWKKGMEKSGGTLNDLVAKRKTLEKGSNEWNKTQNAINAALGSKKRYDVADAAVVKENKLTGRTKATTSDTDPNTGADRVTTTTTRKDGTTARIKSETDDKKSVSRINRDGDKQTNVVKTGRSTDTKEDDVKTKTKIRGGDEPTQTTRTRAADTVTKTETDLKTGDSTSKSRKRLGKGLIKDVVAKAKAKKEAKKAKKAGKVKGSKAPKGTTYNPDTDSSEMPT
jgi:hypothetical protein